MLSIRCVFDVCELGVEESGFVEWFSAGRFELIRLLFCGRFALGGRFDVVLLDVLLVDLLLPLGVAGREAAFEPFDDEGRF